MALGSLCKLFFLILTGNHFHSAQTHFKVMYQSPLFPPPERAISAQGIFGLYKVQEDHVNPYAADVITFDLIIFGLLYAQSQLFKFQDFDVLVQIRNTNRITSIESAIQRFQVFFCC